MRGDAARPIMVSVVKKKCIFTLERAGGEQCVCVGVFVWIESRQGTARIMCGGGEK